MSLDLLDSMNGIHCSCGKSHTFTGELHIGSGTIHALPDIIRAKQCGRPFILADKNTCVAGSEVFAILDRAEIGYSRYIYTDDSVEPDEKSVGSAVMHFDSSCDMVIGIGSGVINDIGKIVSMITKLPYIIVATAPSMDGYASASSSMTRDGLKISLPTRCADVIIGDTDILCQAPLHMMRSGLGDMIAKYVSICEWRISNLVTGEYYCEKIAALIRTAVQRCVENAALLLQREKAAVQAVFEGLVIGGVAMNYAGLSRPASGVEHYISHIIDMRSVEFGSPADLHGIQCAIGTLIAVRYYQKLRTIKPNLEQAIAYADRFDFNIWNNELRSLLGKGAEAMIALEAKENKYDIIAHRNRLEIILKSWPQILCIIQEELPDADSLEALLNNMSMPTSLEQIGIDEKILPTVFKATKDIRDKYVLSRLLWDLGIIDEF